MATPVMISVHGTYLKPNGTPESGTVTFTSNTYARHGASDDTVGPGTVTATLSGTGDFALTVPASNDPAWSPASWTYSVVVCLSGGTLTFDTVVPYDAAGASVSMSSLLPSQVATGALYAAYAHTHAGGGGGGVTPESLATTLLGYVTTAAAAVYVTATSLATTLAGYVTSSALVTALTAYLPKVAPVVTDSTFTVRKSSGPAMRWRATGGALDVEKTSADIILSSWQNDDYTGTQINLQRWRNDGNTFVGKTSFSPTAYGEEQRIENGSATFAATSVTSLAVTGGGAVTGVTKAHVGLGNVDNTSDANKPVSTAQQTALNQKDNKAAYARGYIVSGDVTPGVTAAMTPVAGLTFPIAAVAGDNVTLTVSGLLNQTSSDFFDLVTVVGGVIQRYGSTGSASTYEGDPGIYSVSGAPLHSFTASFSLAVAAGDLSGGNVTFALAFKGAGTGKVFASANYPFRWHIRNDKQ